MVIFAKQPEAEHAAQATGWWEMGSRFREGGSSFEPTHLLAGLAVVIALAILLWLLSRYLQRDGDRSPNSPRQLFRELCREHQLSVSEKWLLWRLASARNLTHPAMVFIDKRCLELESLPHDWHSAKPQLRQLRERLFG